MSYLLRLLTGTSVRWAPDLSVTPDEIRSDLDMTAGDAVWLGQVEEIPVCPDYVPEEWT